jgi:hypothetical protein
MERRQSDRPPDHLSDEELEYYGNLYVDYDIRQSGLDFESFLGNPEQYLRKYAQGRWRGGRDDLRKGRRGILRFLRLWPATRTSTK